MSLIFADRVRETTTSTGTGALTLAGAATGFRAFSAVCSVSDTCYYALQAVDGSGVPTGDWEVGLGTYSASNTLTRTTVLSSSNSNTAVTLAAGTKQVWLDLAAAALPPAGSTKQIQFNDAGSLGGAASLTWDKTNNILTIGSATTPGTMIGPAASTTTSAGVAVTIKGGPGGSTSGAGGAVNILAGVTTSGAGGGVAITGGASVGSLQNAGAVSITGGAVGTTGTAGAVTIAGGQAGPSASAGGGAVTIQGGAGGSTAGPGGSVNITGGAPTAGTGGSINLTGADGVGSAAGAGGSISLLAGAGNFTNAPGTVSAAGGAAGQNQSGGTVSFTGGAGAGVGYGGSIVLTPGGGGSGRGHIVLNGVGSALATSAVGGFTCLPTCAGTPTGTPANIPTGTVPMVVDTTNSKFYLYIGGSWKSVTLA